VVDPATEAETSAPANLFWLDMEMTGLDPETCVIIEVAAIVTDVELNELAEYEAVVRQPPEALAAMDEWNTRTHTKSGLAAAVPGGRELAEVEAELVALADAHFPRERIVLCGNSVGQDKRFVDAYMPNLAARLHYRVIDVSSFKELFTRKWPAVSFKKLQDHRALGDVRESIAELAYYLSGVTEPVSPADARRD